MNIEHPPASQAKRCGQVERPTSNVEWEEIRETEIVVKCSVLDVCFLFDVGRSMFDVGRSSFKTTQDLFQYENHLS